MLNIICDKDDVVVDIASRRENLSRGYTFPGYKEYLDLELSDVDIGDTYKDGVVTKNVKARKEQRIRALQHQIVNLEARREIALDMCFTELSAEWALEMSNCQAELANLSRP